MGGLFSKPKSVKAPPVPDPVAIPEVSDETGDEEMRKAMKRSGFERTILTGALRPKPTGRKTVLG